SWPVTGSWLLGSAFLNVAQEFIYSGTFGAEALQNVLQMKRKIDEKTAGQRQGGRNVKLGPGGIREIELIAQALQVCYGGRIPELQERSTTRALQALCAHELISDEECDALTKAYVFLRDVENKLQMVQDTQTHWLPVAEEELAACANLLGYRTADEFERDYQRHTSSVSVMFEEILGSMDLRRFLR